VVCVASWERAYTITVLRRRRIKSKEENREDGRPVDILERRYIVFASVVGGASRTVQNRKRGTSSKRGRSKALFVASILKGLPKRAVTFLLQR
jgi:hypothetical protein